MNWYLYNILKDRLSNQIVQFLHKESVLSLFTFSERTIQIEALVSYKKER